MTKLTSAEIRLDREPCYGVCPAYSLTLAATGGASWHGKVFVERIGHHVAHIDSLYFERLLSFAERVGFFTWDPQYVVEVTDEAGTRISIARSSGEVHSVYQYATDEPPDFWTLATLIDGVAATLHWEKAEQ